MNGPEDCGLPAGDGKSDELSLLNTWAFEGMAGSGQTLDCTPEPPAPTDNCEIVKPVRPSCDNLGKPSSLTFMYTGGPCDDTANDQGSKTACFETGTLGEPLSITAANSGLTVTPSIVLPGDEFTISGSFGSATELFLDSPDGIQELNIHTSCSAPLAVGDTFGGITLVGFNGQRQGTEVNYFYTVTNSGAPLTNVSVVDNLLGLVGTANYLGTDEERVFTASSVLTDTTTNRVDVTGDIDADNACHADDETTVTVTEACDVCKGGTTEMVLEYLGDLGGANGESHLVSIYDDSSAKPDKVLFEGELFSGMIIALSARPGEDKFNNDVSIFIDGTLYRKIHTSCSQPIGEGLLIGDFTIIEARSRDNGLMCPLEACNVADADFLLHDRELRWNVSNLGDANVAIEKIQIDWPDYNGNLREIKRDGDTLYKGVLPPGSAEVDFGFAGSLKDRTIKHGETDTLKFKFDYDATSFGDYGVTAYFDQGCSVSGNLEAIPETCDICKGGVTDLVFRYEGAATADVAIYDDTSVKPEEILFEGTVDTGDLLAITRRAGEDKLNGNIGIYVNGSLHAEIHTSCSQPLGPNLVIGDFRIIEGRSKDNGPMCALNTCDVEDHFLEFDAEKVRFPVTNKGDATVTVEQLSILWPTQNGNLIEVKHDGDTLQAGSFMPPFAGFDSDWLSPQDKRKIDPGDTKLIEFKFENNATFLDDYEVTAGFDQGCQVFRVLPAPVIGGNFQCEKPVTSLRVQWLGSQRINIVAWDGSVGSDLVTSINGINPFQFISVDGFSGDNSDVYWEIFDAATGQPLGVSKFHVSCSDDDMNGPDDCGKRVGDGKGSSDDYLNDWLFDGMEANGQLLLCADDAA